MPLQQSNLHIKNNKLAAVTLSSLLALIAITAVGKIDTTQNNTSNTTRSPMREVTLSGSYMKFENIGELDVASHIILIGAPTKEFADRQHKETRFSDGTLQDSYTLTSIQVEKIIKKPTNLNLEPGQQFQVIEPVAIVGEGIKGGGEKIKINIEGYQEMKKGKKYILFLASNGLGGFGVINMNSGKFNLDGTDPEDLGKRAAKDEKMKLKQDVLKKYEKFLDKAK